MSSFSPQFDQNNNNTDKLTDVLHWYSDAPYFIYKRDNTILVHWSNLTQENVQLSWG